MHRLNIVKKKAYYYKNPEYQLIPFQFSKEEIELMQKISILAKSQILEVEYTLLKNIVKKIQLFYD